MMKRIFISVMAAMLLVSGCSSSEEVAASGKAKSAALARQSDRSHFLAYEHRIAIDLPRDDIEATYKKVVDACLGDTRFKCTILHSSLSTGDHSDSNIDLRIKPEGVSTIIGIALSAGKLSRQSTDVEDLENVIVDAGKRLDMLKTYEQNLLQLQKQSTNDVDALIKIASELATVQSELEQAEGKKAALMQRVNMDIVHIRLFTKSYISFWQPISDSLGDFTSNLSDGISSLIDVVPYLIPWAFLIGVVFYILMFMRRKFRKK